MATRTVLLNMQPETQGQSHHISNITIGPDNKLYVHMGDGFNAATALNLDQFRGKVLRMNKDGTPVATGDPAGANPFYNAGRRHHRPRLRLHLRPPQPVRRRVGAGHGQALGGRKRQQPRPDGRSGGRPELRLGRQRHAP